MYNNEFAKNPLVVYNIDMYKIYPYVTNDLSVGLFSQIDDDIYHSATGAATEAYTKFILPANIEEFLYNHDSIRVLDICYGIGYNTKSFLNFIFQNKFKNFKINNFCQKEILSLYNYKIDANNKFGNNNDKIYTNNMSCLTDKLKYYNSTIYKDNICSKIQHVTTHDKYIKNIFDKNFSVYIKAIDTDRILAYLSPFINPKISKIPKNQFKNEKIKKFLKYSDKNFDKFIKNSKIRSLIEYPTAVNVFLLDSIVREHTDILISEDFNNILYNENYNCYLLNDIRHIFEKYRYQNNILPSFNRSAPFLHNIYYKYISSRYKNDLKALKSLDIHFELKINDARQEIKSDESEYDFIFLDAFSPTKCPCLWTIDFFKLLYNHLSNDGMILTYSTSAAVRNAFFNAGFYVGKIFNPFENKFSGTVAVKNYLLIKYKFSEFDLGLLKTKAGIFYRDKNLTALNEEIIECRNLEVNKSDLLSSTEYKKNNK